MLETYSNINLSYWKKLERKEIEKKDLVIKRFIDFFAYYNLSCDPINFNDKYQKELGETIVFNDNSYQLVEYLKGKVKQYATTNGSLEAQTKKLNKSGLINLFDDVFISDLIKYNKPDPRFFEYVFKKIGNYQKDEIMIVGDSLTSDIQGGVNVGIKTCWYNPNNQKDKQEIKFDYQISDLNQLLSIIKKEM